MEIVKKSNSGEYLNQMTDEGLIMLIVNHFDSKDACAQFYINIKLTKYN